MLPLRYTAVWRFLSVVLLLAVIVGMLAPPDWFGSDDDGPAWFEHADKLVHGLTFIMLAVWFAGLFERRRFLALGVVLVAFGMLVVASQYLVGYRTADWLDIAANSLGILLGLSLALAGLGGWGRWFEDWYTRRTQH